MLPRRLAFLSVAAAATACIPGLLLYPGEGSGPGEEGGTTEGGRSKPDGGAIDGDAACAHPSLASDPQNCGYCGHDCLGGVCTGGKCQPFAIAACRAGPSNVVLLDGRLYFAVFADIGKGGGVGFVSADGGPVTDGGCNMLATTDLPDWIAVGGGYLVWVADVSQVNSVGQSGGKANVLVPYSDVVSTNGVAASSADVYYSSARKDDAGTYIRTIESVRLSGGAPSQVASVNSAGPVAVDATHFYYSDFDLEAGVGTINRRKLDGTQNRVLASGPLAGFLPESFAVADPYLYWVGQSGVSVSRIPLDGGTVTTLASGLEGGITNVAVDDAGVYFAMFRAGTVNEILLDGGDVRPIVVGRDEPQGVAVDDKAIYWAESYFIYKLAK